MSAPLSSERRGATWSGGPLSDDLTQARGHTQVRMTRDGAQLLVSNEAEQFTAGNNPVGSVSIIDVESQERAEAIVRHFSGPGETVELRPTMSGRAEDA